MKWQATVTIEKIWNGVEVEANSEDEAESLLNKMTEAELVAQCGEPGEDGQVDDLECIEDCEEEDEEDPV